MEFGQDLFALFYTNYQRSNKFTKRLSRNKMRETGDLLNKGFSGKFIGGRYGSRNLYLIKGVLIGHDIRMEEIQRISITSESRSKLETITKLLNLPFDIKKIYRREIDINQK